MMKPCPRCGAMLAAVLVDSPEFMCPRARADKRRVGSLGGLVTNSLAVTAGPGLPPGFPPPGGAAGAASAITVNVTPNRTEAELISMRLASYAMLGDIERRRREQQGMMLR